SFTDSSILFMFFKSFMVKLPFLILHILSIHASGGQALLNHKAGQATGAPGIKFHLHDFPIY
ncbi:MAG: hypothetical protein WCI51_08475, partial [Lentisphaerota bacterium]